MNPRPLSALALTTLTALVVAAPVSLPPAGAALPATCQGEPATIVSAAQEVVGTEGRDVVVAGSDARVRTLGGDDLVCMVKAAGSNMFTVDAGAGDDVVDTTQVPGSHYGTIDLGAGSDRFVGGSSHDGVVADAPGSAEDDVVDTGRGDDHVTTGTHGLPNGDTVLLGRGDDGVRLQGSVLTGTPVDGGPGDNLLSFEEEGVALDLDAAAGTALRGGSPWARWAGFDTFELWKSPSAFAFRGSDRPERVVFYREYDGAPRSIDLAGGDDALHLYEATVGDDYRGGAGQDFAFVVSPTDDLAIDLAAGTVHFDQEEGAVEGTIGGFEGVQAVAQRATLKGTVGADNLVLTGCELRASGRRGADSITRISDWLFEVFTFSDCKRTARAVFHGGRGHDVIRGSLGDDVLRGGRGRDEADGWAGSDLCRAEKKQKCER
ncbi:hypothetical protein [Nocardioides solisilvae]|uniref:hypothetical protein n=1 Tax=Nocardioides solisilvae TaxID=1542435 RepID=UPI000D7488E1|nr:hypothetical protein [Nocardioides solisilvae]